MTRVLAFRILNVFAVDGDDVAARLSGNPLCVFEDGTGLDDVTMQALAFTGTSFIRQQSLILSSNVRNLPLPPSVP